MPQFKVWLLGQGAISLQQDLSFEFSDSSVFIPIRSALPKTVTNLGQYGLEYQVMVDADDQKTAFMKAVWACSTVVDLLSIAHAVSIPSPSG